MAVGVNLVSLLCFHSFAFPSVPVELEMPINTFLVLPHRHRPRPNTAGRFKVPELSKVCAVQGSIIHDDGRGARG